MDIKYKGKIRYNELYLWYCAGNEDVIFIGKQEA